MFTMKLYFVLFGIFSLSGIFAPAFAPVFASANDLSVSQERSIQQSASQERSIQKELSETSEAKAIWRINVETRKGLAKKQGLEKKQATVFFINSDTAIANFKAVDGIEKISDITLTQEGSSRKIPVKGLHALSIFHDLAVLKIEGRVQDYLEIREDLPTAKEGLYIVGYLDGDLKKINKKGSLFQKDSVLSFFIDHFDSYEGMSGSPLIDKQGKVVGMMNSVFDSFAFSKKMIHIKNLIKSKSMLSCDPKECIKKEIQKLKEIANQESNPEAKFRLAQLYKDQEKIKQALSWYRKASDQGHAMSQIFLGFWYNEQNNFKKSISYFTQAADKGHPLASFGLATSYDELEDHKTVFEQLKKAANLGHPLAQFNLAHLYQNQDEISKAIYWQRRAAAQGLSQAKNSLALLYADEGEIKKAINLIKKIAEEGDVASQVNLARFYGLKNNVEQVVKWLGRAASQNDLDAQFTLAQVYKNKKEFDKAIHLYKKAADQDHVESQFELALIYEELGEFKKAIRLYKKVTDQDDTEAQEHIHFLKLFMKFFSPEEIKQAIPRVQNLNVSKSIWRINTGTGQATAFFISSNLIVTNFHVVFDVERFSEITLTQEGNPETIHVEGFYALSFKDDLAILRTKESVSHYLKIKEKSPESKEALHIVGYPDGDLKKIDKTSDLVHKDLSLYFFTSYSDELKGASGSPLLDKEGNVAGVLSSSGHNIIYVEKLNALKRLIKSKPLSLSDAEESMDKEEKSLKKLASQEGNAGAQHRLAMIYKAQGRSEEAFFWNKEATKQAYDLAQFNLGYFYEKKGDTKKAIRWYKKAAEQGDPLAQFNLGLFYTEAGDIKESIKWFKKAAKQGYPLAQSELGSIYEEWGAEEKSIYWYEKAANQGKPDALVNAATSHKRLRNIEQSINWLRAYVLQPNAEATDRFSALKKLYSLYKVSQKCKQVFVGKSG